MTSPVEPPGDRAADPSVDPFTADIAANAGYLYTTNASLSSRLANRRLTDASLAVGDFRGRRVLDVGCGDGTYTVQLVEVGGAARVAALDPSEAALKVAREKAARHPVDVTVGSAFALPYTDRAFDAAYLRGVLHHMERPVDALREALRVATTVVVVEPNGYNPGLKLLERWSTYHVEHGERSYAPHQLDRWVRELGGTVERRTFAGLVPMFCPDWLAMAMKRVEPVVERLPVVRHVGCAVYVFSAGAVGARARPAQPATQAR
jgi:ubiquinone/menaquinone biosynthesis C-methylase UbiE